MGEASMYDFMFLILLFYMYICILYVDILLNKSIYVHLYLTINKTKVLLPQDQAYVTLADFDYPF